MALDNTCCPTLYWCDGHGKVVSSATRPAPEYLGPWRDKNDAVKSCGSIPDPGPTDPTCTPQVCGKALPNAYYRLDMEIMAGSTCGVPGAAYNGILMAPWYGTDAYGMPKTSGCVLGYRISAADVTLTPASGTLTGLYYQWGPAAFTTGGLYEDGWFLYNPTCGISADIFTGQTCTSAIYCDDRGFQGRSFFQAETATQARFRMYRDGTTPPPYCTP